VVRVVIRKRFNVRISFWQNFVQSVKNSNGGEIVNYSGAG